MDGVESDDVKLRLRVPQVDHNCRYRKISQLFKPVYFCRYVKDIWIKTRRQARKLSNSVETLASVHLLWVRQISATFNLSQQRYAIYRELLSGHKHHDQQNLYQIRRLSL